MDEDEIKLHMWAHNKVTRLLERCLAFELLCLLFKDLE